jgi:hypothetical protein
VSEENGSAADIGPGNTAPDERDQNGDALHRAIDVCVFAPVGLALTVVEDLPGMAAKGRTRVELELSNARIVGRYVVSRARRELAGRLGVGPKGGGPSRPRQHAVEPEQAPPTGSGPAPVRPGPDRAAAEVVERALADYDTLSASQVVRRLESLGPEQLRAVQRYEASTRNRRTILNRADQLLEEGPGTPGAAE